MHAGIVRLDPDQSAMYPFMMVVRLLRQIISMLIVAGYLGATIFATAPVACAAPGEMTGGMMMPGDMVMKQAGTNDQTPMPCKGMKTGCVSELGCVFMVTLPTPDLSFATTIRWSTIDYPAAAEILSGRSIKPALGPPISRA